MESALSGCIQFPRVALVGESVRFLSPAVVVGSLVKFCRRPCKRDAKLFNVGQAERVQQKVEMYVAQRRGHPGNNY
jgi:hypothetical protein